MAKFPILLDSTLSTDSHKNDIKDPTLKRDLLSVNRSYLYNNHLTNAKKKIVPFGDYITTQGDLLSVIPGIEKTQIYHNGVIIADVLSLGIEDMSFLDRDDAVIDQGFLWTVQRTLTGYTVEKINLRNKEITTIPVIQNDILDVRFIRNTHKIITRNIGGSVTIEGIEYSALDYPDMSSYLASFNGEFTAVEVSGKIYFGYNNPAGVSRDAPQSVLNFNIHQDMNGWRLIDAFSSLSLDLGYPFDEEIGYIINITVADNVKIGGGLDGFALDLLSGIKDPLAHFINLVLGNNVMISGKGGDGGTIYDIIFPGNEPITAGLSYSGGRGVNGTTAINVGSNINITGNGIIQGGGGGGNSYASIENTILYIATGGGGAGIPAGQPGDATFYKPYPIPPNSTFQKLLGSPGTATIGGVGTSFIESNNIVTRRSGAGGDPGQNGQRGSSSTSILPGQAGNAIRLLRPAACTVNGPIIIGGITEI